MKSKKTNIIKRKTSEKIKTIVFILIIIFLAISIFLKMHFINLETNSYVKKENVFLNETIAMASILNSEDYILQRISEKYRNSNIEVYYPVTKYEKLNTQIKKEIENRINFFKNNVKDNVEYSLFINFDMYKYKDYYGFLFNVLIDFEGAHPDTRLFTINYNISNDQIINIDTLIKENHNILNLISKYSYHFLLQNDKIKEINMFKMLEEGTRPLKENFDVFVFGKKGLIFFFEKYQVAPYAYGEFHVEIPYEELNLKFID